MADTHVISALVKKRYIILKTINIYSKKYNINRYYVALAQEKISKFY